MLNLNHFDEAIKTVRDPIGNADVDASFDTIAKILERFRQNQIDIITELVTMYESASEYDVDVSRDAIFDLANRLTGPADT